MRTVYKYPIPYAGPIQAPENAKPVLFAIQDTQPCVWLEVDPTQPTALYTFRIFPTVGAVPDDMQHFQSLQDGPYIWHLYWKGF